MGLQTFGALRRLSEDAWRRREAQRADLSGVAAIVQCVASEGDAALARIAASFGDPAPGEVPIDRCFAAFSGLPSRIRQALEYACNAVERVARAQLPSVPPAVRQAGLLIEQRLVPVRSAGVYVPAGRHPLPSSAIMGIVPARVAGVHEIVVCTPSLAPQTLGAAWRAGATRVFTLGGPQAVAAMAYGTKLVPRVDIVVGPGNAYVTEAKRLVSGACGIDMLAGPTETVIVASDDAVARVVALDLLAQAEHDEAACVALVTDSASFAETVDVELLRNDCEPQRIGLIVVESLEGAPALVDRLAPEHVALHGAGAQKLSQRFTVYGALFSGAGAAQVFGDYAAGSNHVLPTGGNARYSSGLGPATFLCSRTTVTADGPLDAALVESAEALGTCEGLHAHARAAAARLEDAEPGAVLT